MIWGPSKKVVRENSAEKARRLARYDELLEKLSHMSEAAAMNYLAQNHLFTSSKAGGFMVDARNPYYLIDHADVVRESRLVASARESDERHAARQAEHVRERAERAEEREREEARERSRQLRQRLRAEQGLRPESEVAKSEPRTNAATATATATAPQSVARSAWDRQLEREQAKQEKARIARAQEKEARRAAQDAKRGAMQRARTQAVTVLARVLRESMASAEKHGTDPAEHKLTPVGRPAPTSLSSSNDRAS